MYHTCIHIDIYTQCVIGNLTNNVAAFDLPQLANNGSNSTSCSTDNKGLPFLGLQEFKQTKVCRCSVVMSNYRQFTHCTVITVRQGHQETRLFDQ